MTTIRQCIFGNLTVLTVAIVGLLLIGAAGCGKSSSSGNDNTPTSGAIPTEISPPGDIPDNQAFVTYASSAGSYALDIPEGWAQNENGAAVSFTSKLNSVAVELTDAAAAPTVDSASADEIPTLKEQNDAFEKVLVKAVDLPAGKAVLIRYRANSAPDAVTGKQIRVEVDRYELFKNGKEAALSLSAPAGSDNVDAWNQISKSFTWK